MSSATPSDSDLVSTDSVFGVREFRVCLAATFLASVAMNAQSAAIGWQIYKITHSPLSLGYLSLAQFIPMMAMTLPAGAAADRFDRGVIMTASALVRTLTAATLAVFSITSPSAIWPFYATLALVATARAFAAPAADSLLPRLVPRERFADAVAWSSSSGQVAIVAGPAVGGALYLLGPVVAYSVCGALFLASAIGWTLIRSPNRERLERSAGTGLVALTAGVSYVRRHRLILGSISLDLFAVLLGGATALLPVYARDILHVGPAGLGVLLGAPALGATLIGIRLGRAPLRRNSGAAMFACVALFGLATIAFGLSRHFMLSVAMLTVLGGADMVSVYVRGTVLQLATPDSMRGRVSAVDRLFIGASNQLGGFESGVTAQWFGTVPSVVVGGIGTLAVVGIWWWLFPELRAVNDPGHVAPNAE